MHIITDLFSGGKDILSNFDKFASSYSAPKKTKQGAIASLLIHLISFGYFGFLAYQYGNNQIEPTFAFLQQMNFKTHSIPLTQYLFGFQYFSQIGGSLDDIQAANGLVYILFEVHFYDLSTNTSINIPLVKCTSFDASLQSYYCPDFSQAKDSNGQTLLLTTLRQPQTKVILTAKRCSGLPNCALSTDIDTLLSQQSYFDIIAFANQYNHVDNQFETVYIQETYYFDVNLGINSKINVVNAVTNIYNGALTSTKVKSNSAPYDFSRLDSYNSQALLVLESNQNSLLYLTFELDTFSVKLDIQYSTLMSLVPVAISLGEIVYTFLRQILPDFSKNALSKDIMTANLKGSFAKTAQKLMATTKKEKKGKGGSKGGKESDKNEKKESDIEKKSEDNDEKEGGSDEDKSEKKKITTPDELFKEFDKFKQQEEDMVGLVTKCFEGDWGSLLTLFKKILPCLKKKALEKLSKSQEKQIKTLQKKSSPQQDVNSSIEDILFLKKAVRLLLTPEQYAAVHFTGSDIKEEEDDEVKEKKGGDGGKKSRKNQTSPESLTPLKEIVKEKMNHLEAIENLEKNESELMGQFKKYILSTSYDQEKNTKTGLDQRILDSLIFNFSPNGAPPPKQKNIDNDTGSPNLVTSILKSQLGKFTPDVLKDFPDVSDITNLLNINSDSKQ